MDKHATYSQSNNENEQQSLSCEFFVSHLLSVSFIEMVNRK